MAPRDGTGPNLRRDAGGAGELIGDTEPTISKPPIPKIQVTARRRLPNRRPSTIIEFVLEGRPYRASSSPLPGGGIGEIFLDVGKAGSDVQRQADDAAVLVSLLLQHGIPPAAIRHSIVGPIGIALDLLAEVG